MQPQPLKKNLVVVDDSTSRGAIESASLGSIDCLMKVIAAHYRFDTETYPDLEGATEEKRFQFAVRHSALHFAKTAGQIAAISESGDHGSAIQAKELEEIVSKALINVLKIAELLQMDEAKLVRLVHVKYGVF